MRLAEFVATLRHKLAFFQVRNRNSYLKKNISLTCALLHDSGKAVNILLLGDSLATKIHRSVAGHHRGEAMNHLQKIEAFCDWECARLTKPEKPLNGYGTWQKYYADVDMAEIYKEFLTASD